MALVTHVFNVGDGNFTVTYNDHPFDQDGNFKDKGVLVIGDAGTGPHAPGYLKIDKTPILEAFRNIIHTPGIREIRTVISHDHEDHYKLLPDLFRVVKQEQQMRLEEKRQNPNFPELNIGKFLIGGRDPGTRNVIGPDGNPKEVGVGIHGVLDEIAGIAKEFDPSFAIDAQFALAPADNSPDAPLVNTFARDFTEKDPTRIYFKDKIKEDTSGNRIRSQKYMKFLFPQTPEYFQTARHVHDTNLVAKVVAKRTMVDPENEQPIIDPATNRPAKVVQAGVLWGDASTQLQQQLEAEQLARHQENISQIEAEQREGQPVTHLRHSPTIGPNTFAVMPHHGSQTDNQAVRAANISAGNLSDLLGEIDTRPEVNAPWPNLAVIVSTGRLDQGRPDVYGRLHDAMPAELHNSYMRPNFFFMKDIRDNEVVTAALSFNANKERKVGVQNFNALGFMHKVHPIDSAFAAEKAALEAEKARREAIIKFSGKRRFYNNRRISRERAREERERKLMRPHHLSKQGVQYRKQQIEMVRSLQKAIAAVKGLFTMRPLNPGYAAAVRGLRPFA